MENKKLSELKLIAKKYKISSKLKKSELINEINLIRKPKINLNQDQLDALNLLDFKFGLISAGPGSGKTSLTSFLIQEILDRGKTFCALTFNVAASEKIVQSLADIEIYQYPNSQVLTFHKLGNYILKKSGIKLERNNYKEYIDLAIGKPVYFDYLLIDEAHDISDELIEFTEHLIKSCDKSILIGDPRQEIQPGASFYTNLWSKTDSQYKRVLRYNHRSGTKIVDFLNLYSQKNFSTSHHSQISANNFEGNVKYICCKDYSQILSEILVDSDFLIVCPTSSMKYNLEKIFMCTNEILHRQGKKFKINPISDDQVYYPEDKSQIFAASSLKIKGVERNKVIVVGAELDYYKYGHIEDRLATRRLYVCLSRAISELYIIYRDGNNNPYFYVDNCEIQQDIKERRETFRYFSTTDILPNLENYKIETTYEESLSLNLGKPSQIKGIIIEIMIAKLFNLEPEAYRCFKSNPVIKKRKDKEHGFYLDKDRYVLYLENSEALSFPEILISESDEKIDIIKQYLFIKAIQTGLWMTSDLDNVLEVVSKIDLQELEKIKSLFKPDKYQVPKILNLSCLRSDVDTKLRFVSIIDFIQDSKIIEIKYASKNRKRYALQTAVYSGQFQKEAALINLYTGTKAKIFPKTFNFPFFKTTNLAETITRISYYIRYAVTEKMFSRIPCEITQGKLIVSCDLESWKKAPCKGCNLLEIGAIAAYDSGKVESVLYDVGDFALVCPGKVGLYYDCEKKADLSSTVLYNSGKSWLKTIKNKFVNLKWHCDDLEILTDYKSELEIDVAKIYNQWMELNQIKRGRAGRTLFNCCLDVFGGSVPFQPHNAFEDSLATLLVFLGMTTTSISD